MIHIYSSFLSSPVPPAHGISYLQRNLAILQVKLHDPITITCPIATGVAVPAPTYGWSKVLWRTFKKNNIYIMESFDYF